MPEILTESFCERCGTRYTFEAAAPSRGRFGRLRVASRGLRNYILSDESSLEEAFAEARSDDERSVTSQQLDAFHKTFNFCMSCRQYTCANCWNTIESRCLTCAPHLGAEILPAPFPTLDPRAGMVAAAPATGNGHAPDGSAEAWPVIDLPGDDAAAEAASTPAPGPIEVPLEPSIVAAPPAGVVGVSAAAAADAADAAMAEGETADAATTEGATADGETAEGARPEMPAADAATDLRAAAAAAETAALLSRFRPGDSLDDALEAYEAQADQAATSKEAAVREPALAAAELSEAPEPAERPAVAGTAAEVIAETTTAQADEPGVEEPAVAAGEVAEVDVTETERPARLAAAAAAWQVVAPDHGDQPVPPAPSDTPAWPALPPGSEAPQWPPAPASVPGQSAPPGGSDFLWAASSRDVLGQQPAAGQPAAAVQPCVSCGLALSATARFCRRCGTRQG